MSSGYAPVMASPLLSKEESEPEFARALKDLTKKIEDMAGMADPAAIESMPSKEDEISRVILTKGLLKVMSLKELEEAMMNIAAEIHMRKENIKSLKEALEDECKRCEISILEKEEIPEEILEDIKKEEAIPDGSPYKDVSPYIMPEYDPEKLWRKLPETGKLYDDTGTTTVSPWSTGTGSTTTYWPPYGYDTTSASTATTTTGSYTIPNEWLDSTVFSGATLGVPVAETSPFTLDGYSQFVSLMTRLRDMGIVVDGHELIQEIRKHKLDVGQELKFFVGKPGADR